MIGKEYDEQDTVAPRPEDAPDAPFDSGPQDGDEA